jgi:formylmethanofuran dehydrogenase subunit E
MEPLEQIEATLPEDLKHCIAFHGHLCPGLVYGYRVAKAASDLLGFKRSVDEEIVAISENDSCAVDGIQVILGTTMGKGNLILKDYGKNAYTVLSRSRKKAYRFSRKKVYRYDGEKKDDFDRIDAGITAGTATESDKRRHKLLKAKDLLTQPFEEVFFVEEIEYVMPPYAPLARSEACAVCGEMTMSTKMAAAENGRLICIPCSRKKR